MGVCNSCGSREKEPDLMKYSEFERKLLESK